MTLIQKENQFSLSYLPSSFKKASEGTEGAKRHLKEQRGLHQKPKTGSPPAQASGGSFHRGPREVSVGGQAWATILMGVSR